MASAVQERDRLRLECASLRSMLLQYAQLLIEARGSAGAGAEPGAPAALHSKLSILREAMGATALAPPLSYEPAGLILAPPTPFPSPNPFHHLGRVGVSSASTPITPTNEQQHTRQEACQERAVVNRSSSNENGAVGEHSEREDAMTGGGEVRRELARLRLRDGILAKRLEEAQKAAARKAATASHAVRAQEDAEIALDGVRRELGEAFRALEKERRGREAARAEAEEARRQQQVALTEAAEAHASLLEARAGWAREQKAHEETTSELKRQEKRVEEAKRRMLAAEAQAQASEAETRRSIPQWHQQLTRAEAHLRGLGAQLKEKNAAYHVLDMELQSTRQAFRETEEKLAALRVTHGKLQLSRRLSSSDEAFTSRDGASPSPSTPKPRGPPTLVESGGLGLAAEASLRSRVSTAEAQAEAAEKAKSELEDQLREAMSETEVLKASISELKCEFERLQSTHHSCVGEGTEENAGIEADRFRQEAAMLRSQLVEARAQVSQLHEVRLEAAMLGSQLTEVHARLTEAQTQLADARSQRSQLHQARLDMAALRSQLSEAHSQLEEARTYKSQLVEARREEASLRSQLRDAESQLEVAKSEAASLRSQLGRAETIQDGSEKALNETIDAALLQAALESERQQRHDLLQEHLRERLKHEAHVEKLEEKTRRAEAKATSAADALTAAAAVQAAMAAKHAAAAAVAGECATDDTPSSSEGSYVAVEDGCVHSDHLLRRQELGEAEFVKNKVASGANLLGYCPGCSLSSDEAQAVVNGRAPESLELGVVGELHGSAKVQTSDWLLTSPSSPKLSGPIQAALPVISEQEESDESDSERGMLSTVAPPQQPQSPHEQESPEATRSAPLTASGRLSSATSAVREAVDASSSPSGPASPFGPSPRRSHIHLQNALAVATASPTPGDDDLLRGDVLAPTGTDNYIDPDMPRATHDHGEIQLRMEQGSPAPTLRSSTRSDSAEDGSSEPSRAVRVAWAALSHVGGSGSNPSKVQQDAFFTTSCGGSLLIMGVLDGHGADNGRLAANIGADALKDWFERNTLALHRRPEAAMVDAFAHAHIAIREAITTRYQRDGIRISQVVPGSAGLGTSGRLKGSDGGSDVPEVSVPCSPFLVDEIHSEPIDGGATATVVALLRGYLLVVANVGDSEALLGGLVEGGTIGYEQLCESHTAANLNEFLRVEALRPLLPAEWQPAVFAHDTDIDQLESPQLHGGVVSSASPSGPGSELSTASGVVHGEDAKATFGIESHGRDGPNMGSGKGKEQSPRGEHCRGRSPLLVFERDECGGWRVNPKTIAKLDASENAGFKTARGDRPTALVSPATGKLGEQRLGVTRALGDFYMQTRGASHVPSVSCIDLRDVAEELDRITVILGSDGLWDLWEYEDVLDFPMKRPPPPVGQSSGAALVEPLAELVEATRSQGEALFGETADNITAMVATFDFLP